MTSEAPRLAAIEAETLRTARLDLVPVSLAFVEAVIRDDRAAAERLLGYRLNGWPSGPELELGFPVYLRQLREDPAQQGWVGRAMVLREEGAVIGSANLRGYPGAGGEPEIGYGVIEAYRRRGFAAEAARRSSPAPSPTSARAT